VSICMCLLICLLAEVHMTCVMFIDGHYIRPEFCSSARRLHFAKRLWFSCYTMRDNIIFMCAQKLTNSQRNLSHGTYKNKN